MSQWRTVKGGSKEGTVPGLPRKQSARQNLAKKKAQNRGQLFVRGCKVRRLRCGGRRGEKRNGVSQNAGIG